MSNITLSNHEPANLKFGFSLFEKRMSLRKKYYEISFDFLIGFLASFINVGLINNINMQNSNLIDSFASFEKLSNWALYGVVEEMAGNRYLHVACLMNFDKSLNFESLEAPPIDRQSIDDFSSKIKTHYPDLKLAAKTVFLFDLNKPGSEYFHPEDHTLSTPRISSTLFMQLGREEHNLDFNKFTVYSRRHSVNGETFGLDFLNMANKQWLEKFHYDKLRRDFVDYYSFTYYLYGRLLNWLEFTFHHLTVDYRNGDNRIYCIYYETNDAIQGKIKKRLPLKTTIQIMDSANLPDQAIIDKVMNFDDTPRYANGKLDADNAQVINLKYGDEPTVNFVRNKLDQTGPLTERLFNNFGSYAYDLPRETSLFPYNFIKDEFLDYFAAHLYGRYMDKPQDITGLALPPKICQEYAIGDYLFVLIKQRVSRRNMVHVTSISKSPMNYKTLQKVIERKFPIEENNIMFHVFGKWHPNVTDGFLNEYRNPDNNNILYDIGFGDFKFPPSFQSIVQEIPADGFDRNSFVGISNFEHDEYKNQIANKKNTFEILDFMIEDIFNKSTEALELQRDMMFSFVVSSTLEKIFDVKHSPIPGTLKFSLNDNDRQADSLSLTKKIKCPKKLCNKDEESEMMHIDDNEKKETSVDEHIMFYEQQRMETGKLYKNQLSVSTCI